MTKIINKNLKKDNLFNIKKRFSFKLVIFGAAFIVFISYAFITLVNQQSQISAKVAELDEINRDIAVQEDENEEIKSVYNVLKQLDSNTQTADYEESLKYIEKVAREDYDYSNKGERIFINIAGD